MVLAALVHRHIPPNEAIDLLNVAFENPRSLKARGGEGSLFETPDRITGVKGWKELEALYPREWRFVRVDVGFEETCAEKERIQTLMAPNNSVMDLSIAMAFWFAGRGWGHLDGTPYRSSARVLLSGLGADEQMGGYSRHRRGYEREGWAGLTREIRMDVSRISTRNLGRDDRILSDHCKEVRLPYLDASVLAFLSSLPTHLKMDMRYALGTGDKIILRLVAFTMGMTRAGGEIKRAVQFGARSAKMVESRRKGHEVI